MLTVLGFFALRWLVQRVSPAPQNLGVENGRLAPCPDSPNCVSTQAADDLHGMTPLSFQDSAAGARQKLLQIVGDMPRAKIITSDASYIHVEFRSFTWGFIDDVEFYIDEAAGVVHFRSAARLGEGDAGVNRRRMETISERFAR